ncbi:MAG TPA: MerR family transcriptional regulator [Bryobacteraceae bacterium]|jgi:DNA-binding transcriptional MerR regulator|nr:MerR family transcriptional regulator [Bryobacteraceae bacterium]
MALEMSDAAEQTAVQEIPDKLYFRIGEVSHLAGVKPYVLRFWENEFPSLMPRKSGAGQRLYRRKDVETVLEIKRLLYEKRYTIEGARKFLDSRSRTPTGEDAQGKRRPRGQAELFRTGGPALDAIRTELRAILELLR